jgi:PKD-like domain/Secretion system C-terminal sorting domain
MKRKIYSKSHQHEMNSFRTIISVLMLLIIFCNSVTSFSQTVLIEKVASCTRPPSKPGVISGPKYDLCGLESIVLSINPVLNATSYTWTVPATFTILQDNGTSITLGLPATFGQAVISVTANNECGSSLARTTNIFGNPSRITAVTGPTCVMPNETGLVYSVVNPEAGTTYTWYPPGSARITSGQGTSTVTVTWRATSGILGLRPFNNCGMNARFDYAVTVNCTQAAKTSSALNTGLTVYPNPVSSTANVLFNAGKAGNYTLKISDAEGRLMLTKQGTASIGTNSVSVNMSSFYKGVYAVTVISNEGTQVSKLMKSE